MLGTGLEFRRVRGEDRFYNPANARGAYQNQQTDPLRRAPCQSKEKPVLAHVNRDSEKIVGSTDHPKLVPIPTPEPIVSSLSNLERFLDSIMPSVPALYLSKVYSISFFFSSSF